MFCIMIAVRVIQLYALVKIQQTITLRSVHFIVCHYISKAMF